jgi:hypothetical protein
LEQANEKLHDMEQGMKQYLAYVRDIQGRVEILDLERRIREARFSIFAEITVRVGFTPPSATPSRTPGPTTFQLPGC